MKNDIVSALVIAALFALAIFGGYSYTYNFDRDAKVIGRVLAFDAIVQDRTLILLPGGEMTVSTCDREELSQASRGEYQRCISPEYVGSGEVLVKWVADAYKPAVKQAMTKSFTYTSIKLQGGLVVQ